MKKRKLLSQRHPFFYFLSVWEKRIRRMIRWQIDAKKYTQERSSETFPFRVKKHQSKLLRKLGDVDMRLQHNKVINLQRVVEKIDGVIIRPGETFSFCKMVGRPTKKKGFKLGLELSFGKPQEGIGGGICQSANLLHWLALHSPLEITERHHHSVDPFPDDGRVLPWASGAAIFYNYLDFQLTNKTAHTFQIKIGLTDDFLQGELRVDEELKASYKVFEKNHRFLKEGEEYFRTNEIWRRKIDKITGNTIDEEMLAKNYGKVMYVPDASLLT